MRRGFSLTGVMALCLFLFTLFVTLHGALAMNRQRMATRKLRQAAQWLAISGADLAQSRLAQGEMKSGQTIRSPQFREGRFEVSAVRAGGRVRLKSTGFAGEQVYTVEREAPAR